MPKASSSSSGSSNVIINNNSNNNEDGRKCWSTARDRDRLKARFQIRERVTKGVTSSTSDNHKPQREQQQQVQRRQEQEAGWTTDTTALCKYMTYVQNGDKSKFSLTAVDTHYRLFSSPIPTRLLLGLLESLSIVWEKSIQLCNAWFGHDYAQNLKDYVERFLESFTLMEYAVWMGKHSIVGALLLGGINPCLRGSTNPCRFRSDENNVEENEEKEKSLNEQWQSELIEVGSRVLQRFFDCFPLSLENYIVKRVIEMRMLAIAPATTDNNKDGGNGSVGTGSSYCSCCKCHRRRVVPIGFRLRFPSPCYHSFCEPCFWENVLNGIDERVELDDVVLCPICGVAATTTPSNDRRTTTTTTMRTPSEQYQASLENFRALPQNRQALKSKTTKKKKLSERDQIASSWHAAVLPSLGSTQEVRRDKFFSYVERNAVPYARGCLIAGIDVNLRNEYGQTALYICVWRGHVDLVDLLLQYGADWDVSANGGSNISSLLGTSRCHAARFEELLERHDCLNFRKRGPCDMPSPIQALARQPKDSETVMSPLIKTLISETEDHPGAGSFLVEHAVSGAQVECLLKLYQTLPVDLTQKQKTTPCSERSYYCDAEGYTRRLLERAVTKGLEVGGRELSDATSATVFSHMRFLNYSIPGTVLAPHVDLCRVEGYSSPQRSSHTFILYLTDCSSGGETSLLRDVSGEGRSEVLARVAPKQGRLLVFPHACPHEGLEVQEVPKILLRGELLLTTSRSITSS